MNSEKSLIRGGKVLLFMSTITSLIIIYGSFKGGNFIRNLNSSNPIPYLIICFVNIPLLIVKSRIRKSNPEYWKYNLIGVSMLLVTILVFKLIPRLFWL